MSNHSIEGSEEFQLTLDIHAVVKEYGDRGVHPIDIIRALNIIQGYVLGRTVKSSDRIPKVVETCREELQTLAFKAFVDHSQSDTGTMQ